MKFESWSWRRICSGPWSIKQFFNVYQPKWNVKTNRLYGFEALMRWQHPNLGLVSPGEFIPIAEETGFIVPMTRWALEEACRQGKAWQSQGICEPLSVNLSVRLFQLENLAEMIQGILEKTDFEPRYLELEITESMVLYDVSEVVRQLKEIRELGVRVSMDDFGTGRMLRHAGVLLRETDAYRLGRAMDAGTLLVDSHRARIPASVTYRAGILSWYNFINRTLIMISYFHRAIYP